MHVSFNVFLLRNNKNIKMQCVEVQTLMDFLFSLQDETSFSGSEWSFIPCQMLPSAGGRIREGAVLFQGVPPLPVMVCTDVRGRIISDCHSYFKSFHSCCYLYCKSLQINNNHIILIKPWTRTSDILLCSLFSLWQPTKPLDSSNVCEDTFTTFFNKSQW